MEYGGKKYNVKPVKVQASVKLGNLFEKAHIGKEKRLLSWVKWNSEVKAVSEADMVNASMTTCSVDAGGEGWTFTSSLETVTVERPVAGFYLLMDDPSCGAMQAA